MRIALHEPDIAGNVGTILRLAACFAVEVDIIEPCGFPFSDRSLKRSAMDYGEVARVERYPDFAAFHAARRGRIILFTTRGTIRLPDARFRPDDILLFGSESRGAPAAVHDAADVAVRIPLVPGLRSLNIAVAAGIALGEAIRQTEGWPS
jgi:tRNA (cytidine/uridine-2'-O-)-methyltransferase